MSSKKKNSSRKRKTLGIIVLQLGSKKSALSSIPMLPTAKKN